MLVHVGRGPRLIPTTWGVLKQALDGIADAGLIPTTWGVLPLAPPHYVVVRLIPTTWGVLPGRGLVHGRGQAHPHYVGST